MCVKQPQAFIARAEAANPKRDLRDRERARTAQRTGEPIQAALQVGG